MSAGAVRGARVLVVDDEPDLLTLYELALLREGHQVSTADCLQTARQALAGQTFDVLVTDMRLPDGLGLELVSELQARQRPERAVVITAYGSAENAVQALKQGAFDYLTKPVDLQRFRAVVRDAASGAAKSPLAAGGGRKSAEVSAGPVAPALPARAEGFEAPAGVVARLVGRSAAMQQVRTLAGKVAVSMAPVLLRGESGTGKELLARTLHDMSHRASGPFVAVNCGAIPEALLESEFFGARKGAYTGAQQDREGFFQAATGGTLFLDEIGDLPLAMQSKLLRAIQERCVRPLGSTAEVLVDVRILSATHKPLEQEVARGQFRQDLYYRLNVIELTLPALRERREDLPELASMLLERLARASGSGRPVGLSQEDMALLQTYDFPGNVRELENVLHRAWALGDGAHLALNDALSLCRRAAHPSPAHGASAPAGEAVPTLSVAPDAAPQEPAAGAQVPQGGDSAADEPLPSNLEDYLNQHERRILIKALQETDFNRTAAAQRLGISLRQIRYRMERLQIQVPGSRDDFVDTLASPR